MKTLDITGQKFGKLTALYPIPGNKTEKRKWHCICDCGREGDYPTSVLTNGYTKSCGHCNDDLSGQIFGRLTVLYPIIKKDERGVSHRYQHCVCECENELDVLTYSLISGHTKSCGCLAIELAGKRSFKDLTGQKFGRLTPDYYITKKVDDRHSYAYWHCMCDCGNDTWVISNSLLSGLTKSCGCLKREISKSVNTKHGKSYERIYKIYKGMKDRCNNPNSDAFKYYGEKGIKLCPEWEESFESFYEWAMDNGYTDELTIERIDPTKGYCPENCEWITKSENSRRRNEYYRNKKEDNNNEKKNIS